MRFFEGRRKLAEGRWLALAGVVDVSERALLVGPTALVPLPCLISAAQYLSDLPRSSAEAPSVCSPIAGPSPAVASFLNPPFQPPSLTCCSAYRAA
jgi:hypothetical protein